MWSKNIQLHKYIHTQGLGGWLGVFFLKNKIKKSSSVWKDGIWQEKRLQTRTASAHLWWKLGLIWSSSKCFNITHRACSVHTVPFWSHFRSPTKPGMLHSTCLCCAGNTHLPPPKSSTEGRRLFPQVCAIKCAAENFTLPAEEEVLASSVPELKEHSFSGRRNNQRRERDQELLFFTFGGRLRYAFVWKFLSPRTL